MTAPHQIRDARRLENSGTSELRDSLVVEAPLHIRVNGEAFVTTMRTPGHDEHLARGLLFTEGVLGNGEASLNFSATRDPEHNHVSCLDVNVDTSALAKPVAGRRSLLSSASCGVCGIRSPEDLAVYGEPIAVNNDVHISADTIAECMKALRTAQQLFSETGGSHGAGIFDAQGRKLVVREDIGRHNAVDKAVGWMLTHGNGPAACLAVSGRVSYEIVYKAYRAGIPIVISVGAASTMAVDTSERLGLTLAGFCREGRATVYTRTERVSESATAATAGARNT